MGDLDLIDVNTPLTEILSRLEEHLPELLRLLSDPSSNYWKLDGLEPHIVHELNLFKQKSVLLQTRLENKGEGLGSIVGRVCGLRQYSVALKMLKLNDGFPGERRNQVDNFTGILDREISAIEEAAGIRPREEDPGEDGDGREARVSS